MRNSGLSSCRRRWPRSLISHPLPVLLCSLLGASLYALWITWRFPGGDLSGQYLYVVPIVVPFVAFLFDRADSFRQAALARLVIDALVVGTAMWRAIGHVPFVSGHALFLTYSLLSADSRVARITSALVLLQVIYLKFFVWHDWITPVGGLVLGSAAAFVVVRYKMNGAVERPVVEPTDK